MLPNDPVMLMSFLNARLRDEYESPDDLCASLNAEREDLLQKLSAADYHYNSERNQFI